MFFNVWAGLIRTIDRGIKLKRVQPVDNKSKNTFERLFQRVPD